MIYLDHAATSPVRPEVAERVKDLLSRPLGNPSSPHRAGRQARHLLETAREECARMLGAQVEELVFCSGATEADHLALRGALLHPESGRGRLLLPATEHPAVYQTALAMEREGFEVAVLPVDRAGVLCLGALERALQQRPGALVSAMLVNNEIGTRAPVDEIAALCRSYRALFHCDAVQDPWTARRLIAEGKADLLCLSGHKLGGLPGGLLYVRQGIPLAPQLLGGGQEDGRRAGTSEVIRAASLACALKATLAGDPEQLRTLRDLLEAKLACLGPEAIRLGPTENSARAPQISSWLFGTERAETLLAQWDLAGLCASSGSACSSNAVSPSRVLAALGFDSRFARSLIRFSFGWSSRTSDVEEAAELVVSSVQNRWKRQKVSL